MLVVERVYVRMMIDRGGRKERINVCGGGSDCEKDEG